MKKLLALVLALIMVLGLAVTAFADTSVIVLDEDEEETEEAEKIYPLNIKNTDVIMAYKGGKYYLEVENKDDYEDLAVEATGAVSAKLIKWDPEDEDYDYVGVDKTIYAVKAAKDIFDFASKNTVFKWVDDGDKVVEADEAVRLEKEDFYTNTYAEAKALKKALNKAYNTDRFVVVSEDVPTLLVVDVEPNYTAAYKEGKITVTAKIDDDGEVTNYKKTITVIRDVCIFGYEDVKDAAKNGYALSGLKDTGYSDYVSAKLGYRQASQVLDKFLPTVVPTTSFKAIEGKDLKVKENQDVVVTIKKVAAGQKGVNFFFEQEWNADDDDDKKLVSYDFGFKGTQVIASDFEIEVDLDCNWFELREAFKQKLEEEDVVTYYILKDGKLFDTVVYDYGKETVTYNGKTKDADYDEDIELTINGKAGETLGYYTIQLTAPAAKEAEENPNTGAESVVSVVAALAVVAVASAAAVSLKK